MIPAILPKIQPIKITKNFGITDNYHPLQNIEIFYNTTIAKNTGTKTIAIVLSSLITVFSAGPAVSLYLSLIHI